MGAFFCEMSSESIQSDTNEFNSNETVENFDDSPENKNENEVSDDEILSEAELEAVCFTLFLKKLIYSYIQNYYLNKDCIRSRIIKSYWK